MVLIKPTFPFLASKIFEKVKKNPPGGKPGGLGPHGKDLSA
jgi:hypothetical protein